METDAHVDTHKEAYESIANRLELVRETFESAPPEVGRSMLTDGVVYAVMSVQNSVEKLERAFRGYGQLSTRDSSQENELRSVAKKLNYGNAKLGYIRDNIGKLSGEIGETIRLELIDGSVWTAVELLQEHCAGLSWIKGAFVPAMLGFTDVLCIDTNVAQMIDDDSVVAKGYTSATHYRTAVETVLSEYPELTDNWSPFMVQWILFDANRGDSVEFHDEWFEAMIPGTMTSRQTSLAGW